MRAINLIPPDERRGAGGLAGRSGGGAYVVIGALVALVIIGIVYAFSVHDVASRTTTLAGTTAEVGAVDAQSAALQPYVQFAALSQQRVEAVATVAEQRFDWARAMKQIALALPSTVTINSLSGTAGTAPTPIGATATRADAAPASFSLSGCAASQLVVAETVTRLRELKDVASATVSTYEKPASVSLKQSKKTHAYQPCTYVTWNMTINYNAGYALPSPKLPAGVSAVRG